MIDTDKYEGHTPGPWRRNINADYPVYAGEAPNHTHVAIALQSNEINAEANMKLIADAPLLLAEVKRLQICIAEVVDVVQNCNYESREDYFNHFCEVHAELAGNIFHAGDVILGGEDI
tara:strand:- start:1909 stop:2262 length:354 start_codon:yes stop_codon:yes gene_type:complete